LKQNDLLLADSFETLSVEGLSPMDKVSVEEGDSISSLPNLVDVYCSQRAFPSLLSRKLKSLESVLVNEKEDPMIEKSLKSKNIVRRFTNLFSK
jgi:hypothetical protein